MGGVGCWRGVKELLRFGAACSSQARCWNSWTTRSKPIAWAASAREEVAAQYSVDRMVQETVGVYRKALERSAVSAAVG